MSATARAARPAARPAAHPAGRSGVAARAAERRRSARPDLREVPAPAPAVAGTGTFALVVTGLLLGGMLMLLVLNTSLAQGAFEMGALSKAQRELAVTEQRLIQEVAVAESPESLQREARRLGMVASVAPVFLRLSDGEILGTPQPADAVPVAASRLAPPALPAAPEQSSTSRSTTRSDARTPAGNSAASDAAVADPAPQTDAAVLDGGSAR